MKLQEFLSLSFIEILTNYSLDFDAVINLHINKNLSLEDCLYLQVCLENDLRLVTFDKKLKKEFDSIQNQQDSM